MNNKSILKARSYAKVSVFLTSIPLIILLGVFLIISQFSVTIFIGAFCEYLIIPVLSGLLFIIPLIILSHDCTKCIENNSSLDFKKVKILRFFFVIGFICACIVLLIIAMYIWFDSVMFTSFLLSISPLVLSAPLAFSAFNKARQACKK